MVNRLKGLLGPPPEEPARDGDYYEVVVRYAAYPVSRATAAAVELALDAAPLRAGSCSATSRARATACWPRP